MIEQLIEDLAHALGAWAYLLVGGMSFLETAFFVGLFAPGEFTVILGGVLAGQGQLSVFLMIGVVWLCAFLGDTTSFILGRKLGRDFVIKHGRRVRVTPERLTKVERYFARHGGKTILVGRFLGLVRALAPFSAGASGMRYGSFLPYDVLGTGLWGTAFVLLGYFFWQSFEEVVRIAGRGTLVFAILVLLIIVASRAKKRLRRPVLPKRLRFIWDRFTPGGLGLELTSLMAVAAVGAYVVILYLTLLSGNLGPTAGDREAAAVARSLQLGWINDISAAATTLGDLWFVGVIAGLVAVVLVRKRLFIETAILVGGVLTSWFGALILKVVVERPRPLDGLIEVGGSSFPSGHAAVATTYLAVAVLLARAGLGPWRTTLLVGVGASLTAVIGLTRIYLDVHYLSDVTAGWALGLAAFAFCGIVGLVVGYLLRKRRGQV